MSGLRVRKKGSGASATKSALSENEAAVAIQVSMGDPGIPLKESEKENLHSTPGLGIVPG